MSEMPDGRIAPFDTGKGDRVARNLETRDALRGRGAFADVMTYARYRSRNLDQRVKVTLSRGPFTRGTWLVQPYRSAAVREVRAAGEVVK